MAAREASAAGPPAALDFAMNLPPSRLGMRGAAAARSGRTTTPVLRAPARFDLIGLRWRTPGDPEIEVRARLRGRPWSDWVTMAGAAHGPDSAADALGTEPVWLGGADEFQMRIGSPPQGLSAHFVNSSGTATAADRVRTGLRAVTGGGGRRREATELTVQAAASRPRIIPRAAWGGDQLPPRRRAATGRVQLAFVHHTVTANSYRPQDSAAVIRGIQRYHRNVNGWDDIGYNFLVDRYGQVFEGRAGGAHLAVVGAHAQGYNGVSTGIATLGTFGAAPASSRAISALAGLIAWKLKLHGAPVQGKVAVVSAGGSSNRYPQGTAVTLDRVSGHRDGDSTSCPGAALYSQLPRLRALAARSA